MKVIQGKVVHFGLIYNQVIEIPLVRFNELGISLEDKATLIFIPKMRG